MGEKSIKKLNIGIIGLGLIGGSFARAFSTKTPHRVFGRGRTPASESASAALKAGAIAGELTDAIWPTLDVLIFAVNPRTTVELLAVGRGLAPAEGFGGGKYLPLLKPGCIVTDAGGIKRGVVAAMEQAAQKYPALQFIAAHPMAGREFSGFSASFAELFAGASVLLIPVNASQAALEALKELLSDIGFNTPKVTTAAEHDKMIAYTSQLCHAISACYCLNPLSSEHEGFSAGSFKDLTRVARLNAQMWAELFCDNADELSATLEEFIAQISALKRAVEARDEAEVFNILSNANERRLTF
ncbi:MAG: prephenate dehydrogenase [Firmicutes bacterium]|nr:prephenate dehydrogenase [Bacillota bacterium]